MQKIGKLVLVGGLALALGCLGEVVPPQSQQQANNGNGGGGGTGSGSGSGSGSGPGSGNQPPSSQGGSPGSGGSPGTPPTPPPPDLGQPVSTNACIPMAAAGADGMHNAGQACLSCHNGSGATKFYAAGTVYNAGSGAGGVTVEVTDSLGVKVQMVTAGSPTGAEGNFHTTQALTPPLTVRASSCPADQHMPGTAGSGDCNSCHGSGNQIHLP
jgi:hypothetical protein